MEGEAIASRVLELGPSGAKFLGDGLQGGQARLRPRFRLLISGILLSLPSPAWADGNMAE